MIPICILLSTIILMLFLIWINTFKKKPKQEPADISDKEYLEALLPQLPDDSPRLHQYKLLVVKTERKKQKWYWEIWNNEMSKKLIIGNSLATDKRSYEKLIKDIENDIDQYLRNR